MNSGFKRIGLFSSALYALAAAWSAQAQPVPGGLAQQAAGLFMHSCVAYTGNPTGLRQFLDGKHVPLMKQEAVSFFVKPGFSGVVYDASNASGRLAVVSHDNGACTVISDNADGDQAVTFVEQFLRGSNVSLVPTEDQPDPRDTSLRHRGYNADLGERKWLIVLSTSSVAGKLHVQFTASPRA